MGWQARETDKIFSNLAKDCAPLPFPLEERLLQQNNKPDQTLASSLPRVTSLLNMVQCVEQWQKGFEGNRSRLSAAKKEVYEAANPKRQVPAPITKVEGGDKSNRSKQKGTATAPAKKERY